MHDNPPSVTVVRPSAFERRILAGEGSGGEPVAVRVVAPTVVAAGEPFDLRLAVIDELGFPCVDFEGEVTIRGDFAAPAELRAAFDAGAPAVAKLCGLRIDDEGLFRFAVDSTVGTFHSNPVCADRGLGRRIYWGDPHVHTVLSNCHADHCRSTGFCFVAARWLSCLDWVTAADHVSNGRCELARWKEQAATSDAFDDPPAFVTLPGYEASLKGDRGGDNNVYMRRWPDMFVDAYADGDVRTLCDGLSEKLAPGEEFFVVPHHTTRTVKHGEIPDEIYPGEALMPAIEIHSKWGASEYRGNPEPLQSIHPGPSYAVDLLARGLPLGFVGGTDTHATMPAGVGDDMPHVDRLPGMTAVRTDGLTRQAVFDAIATRDCYATSLERIYLDFAVAGAEMGQRVRWADPGGPREIRATAAGRTDIRAIELVRNGETIHRVEPGDWRGELTFTDADDLSGLWLESLWIGRFVHYYVRVSCESGARAWSSPIWLNA